MSVFDGLGKALRWLRAKQDKRQYQLAGEAGITKAMLSAYETGKQRPSLDTLEKVLEALGVGLAELHDALEIVNERAAIPGRRPGADAASWLARRGYPGGERFDDPADDVYRILAVDRTLPIEEERAFREMLGGFHRFIRFLHHRSLGSAPPPSPPSPPAGPSDDSSEG